jgi:S1-C subfamily serine protease
LQLSTWAGVDFSEPVVSLSPGPDLALVTGHPSAHVPPIDSADLVIGTPVWVAGYPLGDQLSVISGTVIGYDSGAPYDEPGLVMEVTNAVQHGNSGGPLLDSDGQVVGIVFAIDTTNNDGLVIPASTLTSFLHAPGTSLLGQCLV